MTNPGSGRLQILIVDDEVEIRELLGEYFSARGHDAHVVSDGQAAQTWLAENPVDILLTDVQMPSLSGVDLIATLKDRTEPLGIVVMTGFPTVESATRAMKLGASDYLLKPFRLRAVYEAVSRAAIRVARQRRVERMAARAAFYEVLMGESTEAFPTSGSCGERRRTSTSSSGRWRRVRSALQAMRGSSLAAAVSARTSASSVRPRRWSARADASAPAGHDACGERPKAPSTSPPASRRRMTAATVEGASRAAPPSSSQRSSA